MDLVLAAIAIISFAWGAHAGAQEVQRRRKLRRDLAELLQFLRRLVRLDRRLCAVVAELDDRLAAGAAWEGPDAWPRPLKGRLIYLDGMIDELDRAIAQVRALEADGSTERLRADIERLARVLREAADEYQSGTFCSYREFEGEAITLDRRGAFETTPTLHTSSERRVRELRDEATLLFRTCWYRLDADHTAERYKAVWPVERHEAQHINTAAVWATEPNPIDW